MDLERPVEFGSDTWLPLGCGPDGLATLAMAEEGFAGTYTAWPYVVGYDMDGSPLVLVGEPGPVTFVR